MNLASIRSSAYDVVEAWRDANPALLAKVHRTRPASFVTACAYIGDIRTRLNHDTGLRMWTAEVDIVLIDMVTDNEETMDRMDVVAMALVNEFTDQPHAFGANTVAEPRSVAQTTDEVAGVPHQACVITVGRILFTEGR